MPLIVALFFVYIGVGGIFLMLSEVGPIKYRPVFEKIFSWMGGILLALLLLLCILIGMTGIISSLS